MLIRQHLSLIKMNVHIFGLKIWKSFVQLHGSCIVRAGNDNRTSACYTSLSSTLQLLYWKVELGIVERSAGGSSFPWFWSIGKRREAGAVGNLIQYAFSSLIVLFTFHIRGMSLHSIWGGKQTVPWLLESCLVSVWLLAPLEMGWFLNPTECQLVYFRKIFCLLLLYSGNNQDLKYQNIFSVINPAFKNNILLLQPEARWL